MLSEAARRGHRSSQPGRYGPTDGGCHHYRVAGYKYPRKIWFVDELPKGPTGKILKRDIVIPTEA